MKEKHSSCDYHNVLPGELTKEDIDLARQFLEDLSPTELDEWTERRIESLVFNFQRFRTIIDRPKDGNDDKAVVVLSEFGTGIRPRLVAKSRVIRDMVDPAATLLIQPSSTFKEPNMGLTAEEQIRVYRGDLWPIIGRVATAMRHIGSPDDITIFAPSEGATKGLAIAANEVFPPSAIAAVEPQSILNRTNFQLAIDFMNSGKDLSKVVKSNFENHQAPFAVQTERDASTLSGMMSYLGDTVHPDNLAMIGAMRRKSAAKHINSILNKGGSVVHAWGDQDNASPNLANESIAAEFALDPMYAKRVLRGMGHAASDFYALDGALARLAHDLKKNR